MNERVSFLFSRHRLTWDCVKRWRPFFVCQELFWYEAKLALVIEEGRVFVKNVTVSTMGLPFFLSCSQESHTEAFSFFSQTMADYYQGLGLTFSHCVDVWVCIELWQWGNILSTAARLMFVALKPRLKIDIMANFGLQYNTSWFSRGLTWWNIR